MFIWTAFLYRELLRMIATPATIPITSPSRIALLKTTRASITVSFVRKKGIQRILFTTVINALIAIHISLILNA
jgi:hypothetical protein